MGPTQPLIDDIFVRRVLQARRTPPAEKFLDGPRLFDFACRVTKDGIRHQHPDADEARIDELLRERVKLLRRMEDAR